MAIEDGDRTQARGYVALALAHVERFPRVAVPAERQLRAIAAAAR
jgi:hypothetical protein